MSILWFFNSLWKRLGSTREDFYVIFTFIYGDHSGGEYVYDCSCYFARVGNHRNRKRADTGHPFAIRCGITPPKYLFKLIPKLSTIGDGAACNSVKHSLPKHPLADFGGSKNCAEPSRGRSMKRDIRSKN